MKVYIKIMGFGCLAFVLIMHIFDFAYPGFIPSAQYLLPFKIIAIASLAYIAWKKVEPVAPGHTKLPWKTWIIGLAIASALMYKAYARTELPFWVYIALFSLFIIISGTFLHYERRYSRGR